MTAYWHPTAASYFGRVSKERIAQAVREAVSDQAAENIAHDDEAGHGRSCRGRTGRQGLAAFAASQRTIRGPSGIGVEGRGAQALPALTCESAQRYCHRICFFNASRARLNLKNSRFWLEMAKRPTQFLHRRFRHEFIDKYQCIASHYTSSRRRSGSGSSPSLTCREDLLPGSCPHLWGFGPQVGTPDFIAKEVTNFHQLLSLVVYIPR
jgi:hypothetical protein